MLWLWSRSVTDELEVFSSRWRPDMNECGTGDPSWVPLSERLVCLQVCLALTDTAALNQAGTRPQTPCGSISAHPAARDKLTAVTTGLFQHHSQFFIPTCEWDGLGFWSSYLSFVIVWLFIDSFFGHKWLKSKWLHVADQLIFKNSKTCLFQVVTIWGHRTNN